MGSHMDEPGTRARGNQRHVPRSRPRIRGCRAPDLHRAAREAPAPPADTGKADGMTTNIDDAAPGGVGAGPDKTGDQQERGGDVPFDVEDGEAALPALSR